MGKGGTRDADGVLQPMESEVVGRAGLHCGDRESCQSSIPGGGTPLRGWGEEKELSIIIPRRRVIFGSENCQS